MLKNKYEIEYEEEKSPIFSLKSGAKYYVFMEMRNEKKVKITLTMNNNIYTSPFSSIVIYELYNQDSININTNKVYLDKQDIANENGDSVISFSYECSRSYTSKIVLEITPNYDIDYLITEFKYSFTLPIGLIIFFLILGLIIVLIIIICLVRICKRKQNSSDKIDRLLMDI